MRDQLARALRGSIGDDKTLGLLRQQRGDDSASRATHSQQQDPAPAQLHAEVALEIAHQTRAIGVVGLYEITLPREKIRCTGKPRAIRYRVGETKGLNLEG